MENSILKSTKMMLDIPESDTAFDHVITVHTNSVFSDLDQLGIGPTGGFEIGDDGSESWDDFITAGVPETMLRSVRTYVFLRVKELFDPPTVGYLVEATKAQIQRAEWRMNVAREEQVHPLSEFVEEDA